MASVDWAKHKGSGAAKAMFRHTTKDWRATHEHSNPHIDTSLTHRNTALSGLRDGHELTYVEMCEKYDNRIATLDAQPGANKRKDRITMLSLEVPLPSGVPEHDSDSWFLRVAEIMESRFDAKNVIDMHVDRDEQHDYIDAQTKQKRRSRIHAVFYVVPEVDGRLCAKRLMTKRNMRGLNDAIDKMTEREYGCSFMTGDLRKSTEEVEELKRRSALAALEALAVREREVARREEAVERSESALRDAWAAVAGEKALVSAQKREVEAREAAVLESAASLARRESAVEERERAVGRVERAGAASSRVRSSSSRRVPHAPSV